ncbi:MAG: histidinol-phosphate aminotransferase family protein [Clostridiales Family XIII bacterium]|jgi:histidinol-phosphate aminotransferase|nr:histidinol-phosphate aminotransferase family protein [Clostridiales Family XIII bacterium]
MKLKIRETIIQEEKLSYAKDGAKVPENAVDCAAGYNPFGTPPESVAVFKDLSPSAIFDYPHGDFLQEAILKYWSPFAKLTKKNLLLTDGSMPGLTLVNAAFSVPGAAALASAPQFSDYTSNAAFMNITYKPVYLKAEENYKFDADDLLAAIDGQLSLIYLDNPNNPTGQTIPAGDLRRILDKAREHNVCVLSDEAYGDFVEESASAISLLDEYENLIVLRTFSKGFGMAGLRAGYLLAGEELAQAINKLHNPYAVSQPSRMAAAASLSNPGFLQECRAAFGRGKAALKAATGNKMHMAHTFETCSICLLYHDDPEFDLEAALMERGILTYSGANFDGLGINSVRLRIPHENEWDRMIAAVKELNG